MAGLLSGGARTMIGRSFLFAIHMLKPNRFCARTKWTPRSTNRISAASAEFLDRFVYQSQFVIITHNQRTISRAADLLYGVTMEEHGVSKLVSVKFTARNDSADRSQSADEAFDGRPGSPR